MALQPRQCASSSSTIHLDHGVDSAPFDPRDLRVSARGLSLPSRWRFEPGAEVAVNFQLDEGTPGPLPPTLRTTGMVVDCEPDTRRAGVFWLTLIFLDSTDDVLSGYAILPDGVDGTIAYGGVSEPIKGGGRWTFQLPHTRKGRVASTNGSTVKQ